MYASKDKIIAFLTAVFTSLFGLTALIGCNSNCAEFTVVDIEASSPAVVTAFFQLSDCDGTPMPGMADNEFIIKENGSQLSTYESDQTILNDPQRFLLSTVLLLDVSGSIIESDSLNALQKASKTFINGIGEDQEVAIYTFDGRVDLQELVPFTRDEDLLKDGINSLSDYEVVDKSTNLNGAVREGVSILDERKEMALEIAIFAGSLAIFTDGTDLAARYEDDSAVGKVVKSEHAVYTIGLGQEVDKSHLGAIGKSGAFYAEAEEHIEQAFKNAAQAIWDKAHSYYILAYCSPKREGYHTLELSISGFGGKLEERFNSNGFIGGCSPDSFFSGEPLVDGDEEDAVDGDGETTE